MRTGGLVALAAAASTSYGYKTWTVDVGGASLVFSPEYIPNVPVGDVIQFRFQQKNHTATQSSFNEPCRPLLGDFGQPVGFDTGFTKFVPPGSTYFPTFEVTVNDTNPIWVYCSQIAPPAKTHCQQGMVFSVNAPPNGNTHAKFKDNAMKSTAQNSDTWSVTVPDKQTSTGSGTATYSSQTGTYTTGSTSSYVSNTYTSTSTSSYASNTYTTSTWTGAAPSGTMGYGGTGQPPTTYFITVGGLKDGNPVLQFNPPYVHANIGDSIEFMFDAANHSATVSSFDEPCLHDPIRFDTGFMPFNASTAKFMPKSSFVVTDDKPIWMFCRQPGKTGKTHCQSGMVFAVNPQSSGKTFDAFLAKAKASTIQNMMSSNNSTGYSKAVNGGSQLASGGSLTETEAETAQLNKIQSYGPIILGLLGALIALVVILIGLVALLFRSRGDNKNGRSYVPVGFPSKDKAGTSKLAHDESYEYETPSGRYTD